MSDYISCPIRVIKSVEKELYEYLTTLVKNKFFPRAYLAFIHGNGFNFSTTLWTDANWVIKLAELNNGSLGEAIEYNQIIIWDKAGKISIDNDFRRAKNIDIVDERTIFEIVAPILYNGKPCGALLVDLFEGEELNYDLDLIKAGIFNWKLIIEKKLINPPQIIFELYENLNMDLEKCGSRTKSKRGYVAIRHWSGKVEYISWGKSKDVFIPLDLEEGLCGEAFINGIEVNEGNVHSRTGYIPSDIGIMSELVIPLKIDNRVVGVLNLESSKKFHYKDTILNIARDTSKLIEAHLEQAPEYFDIISDQMIVQVSPYLNDIENIKLANISTFTHKQADPILLMFNVLKNYIEYVIGDQNNLEIKLFYGKSIDSIENSLIEKFILGEQYFNSYNIENNVVDVFFPIRISGNIIGVLKITSKYDLDIFVKNVIIFMIKGLVDKVKEINNYIELKIFEKFLGELVECNNRLDYFKFSISSVIKDIFSADEVVIFEVKTENNINYIFIEDITISKINILTEINTDSHELFNFNIDLSNKTILKSYNDIDSSIHLFGPELKLKIHSIISFMIAYITIDNNIKFLIRCAISDFKGNSAFNSIDQNRLDKFGKIISSLL